MQESFEGIDRWIEDLNLNYLKLNKSKIYYLKDHLLNDEFKGFQNLIDFLLGNDLLTNMTNVDLAKPYLEFILPDKNNYLKDFSKIQYVLDLLNILKKAHLLSDSLQGHNNIMLAFLAIFQQQNSNYSSVVSLLSALHEIKMVGQNNLELFLFANEKKFFDSNDLFKVYQEHCEFIKHINAYYFETHEQYTFENCNALLNLPYVKDTSSLDSQPMKRYVLTDEWKRNIINSCCMSKRNIQDVIPMISVLIRSSLLTEDNLRLIRALTFIPIFKQPIISQKDFFSAYIEASAKLITIRSAVERKIHTHATAGSIFFATNIVNTQKLNFQLKRLLGDINLMDKNCLKGAENRNDIGQLYQILSSTEEYLLNLSDNKRLDTITLFINFPNYTLLNNILEELKKYALLTFFLETLSQDVLQIFQTIFSAFYKNNDKLSLVTAILGQTDFNSLNSILQIMCDTQFLRGENGLNNLTCVLSFKNLSKLNLELKAAKNNGLFLNKTKQLIFELLLNHSDSDHLFAILTELSKSNLIDGSLEYLNKNHMSIMKYLPILEYLCFTGIIFNIYRNETDSFNSQILDNSDLQSLESMIKIMAEAQLLEGEKGLLNFNSIILHEDLNKLNKKLMVIHKQGLLNSETKQNQFERLVSLPYQCGCNIS